MPSRPPLRKSRLRIDDRLGLSYRPERRDEHFLGLGINAEDLNSIPAQVDHIFRLRDSLFREL